VFSSIADVRDVLDRYDHPRLGVCMDTGHFLVEDVAPDDVIAEVGDRINSVHLKDTSEAEVEDLPGAGQLDLPPSSGYSTTTPTSTRRSSSSTNYQKAG